MAPDDDLANWVAAARAGSEDAWRVLIDAHETSLVRLAWAITGRRDAAAEAAQEALVEAFLHIRQLRDDRAFGAWVRRILVRAARRRRRAPPQALGEIEDHRTPLDDAKGRELRTAVDAALAALSPQCREALALAMDGELSSAEAAKALGCSPEAYRVRLHKARREVRRMLAEFLED